MRLYGLVGRVLTHSFSPDYFSEKFKSESISDTLYQKWELPDIGGIKSLVQNEPLISGFNVTIPYKQEILPWLDAIDPAAEAIGAVNTVVVKSDAEQPDQKIPGRRLKGYNTDVLGFSDSIKPLIRAGTERALVLGTGGSSLAVCYVLRALGIRVLQVSRNPVGADQIGWQSINEYVIRHHRLIVNTTPLGQYPNTAESPVLPYEHIGSGHVLYDLIYNPAETLFLQRGRESGALVQNGYGMLCLQADYSWKIWQDAYQD
jgi:shikimate dehydrogenase